MMRQIGAFFIITALILTGTAYAQQTGSVSIISKPEACWVRIDSVLIGKTPLNQLKLPVGPHTVQVYPPQSGVWNLQERIYQIRIKSFQDTAITVLFSTPVLINSVPYGATIYRDSLNLGVTPIYIPFEENQGKELRLEKSGFRPYIFTLTLRKVILAQLEQDDSYTNGRQKPQLTGFVPKKNAKLKFLLLGITVASHWASFYFKNVADSNFDKYLQTGDSFQREKFLKQTEKFDRYSEISLGVSFASLAGLIYTVIWH